MINASEELINHKLALPFEIYTVIWRVNLKSNASNGVLALSLYTRYTTHRQTVAHKTQMPSM
jgi:hypothetical protein